MAALPHRSPGCAGFSNGLLDTVLSVTVNRPVSVLSVTVSDRPFPQPGVLSVTVSVLSVTVCGTSSAGSRSVLATGARELSSTTAPLPYRDLMPTERRRSYAAAMPAAYLIPKRRRHNDGL